MTASDLATRVTLILTNLNAERATNIGRALEVCAEVMAEDAEVKLAIIQAERETRREDAKKAKATEETKKAKIMEEARKADPGKYTIRGITYD